MFDIDLQSSLAAEDPDATTQIKDNRPPVAPLTGVPNRYTVFVPSEKTTLSLGEKCPEEDRIDDVGVTARTDNHIHFHVAKNHKTVVSLGGPSTTVTDALDVESQDPKVPAESVGYSMVTDDVAWHDAKKQHYLVSRTADIVVRTVGKGAKGTAGPAALLQSDLGCTTVGAGNMVTIGGIGGVHIFSHPGLPMETDEGYDKPVGGKMELEFSHDRLAKAVTAADLASGAACLFDAAFLVRPKQPEWKKKLKWKPGTWVEYASLALDAVKLGMSGWEFYKSLNPKTYPSANTVDIIGEGGITANTPATVGIYGSKGVGISSALTVDLVGTTAGVKAYTFAGVWAGLVASLTGIKDAKVEARFGCVGVAGQKGVDIGSESGGVKIGAKTDVQLTGENSAMLHGKTMYCAGGEATSYGLLATKDEIHVGKFSAGHTLDAPGKVKDEGIVVKKDKIEARIQKSHIDVEPSVIKVTSKGKVNMTADGGSGTIVIHGKVLLG